MSNSCCKILFIGNSHLFAVSNAWENYARFANFDADFLQLGQLNHGDWARWIDNTLVVHPNTVSDIEERIKSYAPARVYLSIGGSEYFVQSAVHDNRKYDFTLPDMADKEIGLGTEQIPFSLMRMMCFKQMENVLSISHRIHSLHDRVYALPVPPPPQDNAFFLDNLPVEFRDAAVARGLTANVFRLKMWALYDSVSRELYSREGMQTLDLPADIKGDEGFISCLYQGDAVHGNIDYGMQVLLQLSKEVEGLND